MQKSMFFVHKTSCVQRQNHEVQSGQKNSYAHKIWSKISPHRLEKGNVVFSLTRQPWLPHSRTFPIDQILIFWPFLIVTCLLTDSRPFLLVLPLCIENYAPQHDEKGIKEISRAVLSRELKESVVKEGDNADDGGEQQPCLHECHKGKICLWISSKIFFHIPNYDSSVFWIFVNGHQFLETCVPHNVAKRVYLTALLSIVLLLDEVGQQIVILSPKLFFRCKERVILWVVALFVWEVLAHFFLVEYWVLFLHVDLFVDRLESGPDPF